MKTTNSHPHKTESRDWGPLIMLGLTLLMGLVLFFFGNGRTDGSSGRDSNGFQSSGETAVSSPSSTALPSAPEDAVRIAVASDLHLDPDNTDHSGILIQASYSLELVDALLWDAEQRNCEILLLTGDLVNGGKLHRHEALVEKLRKAEAQGLRIFVLPGNHDLAPVSQSAFAELYSDFGYREALSQDRSSLSYSVTTGGLMLLMLDTGGYRAGAIDLPGAPERDSNEAFLSPATLSWVEEQLQEAQKRGLHVLCAGHYNLLTSISREPGSGFYLENGDRLAALLRKYSVPLYLSGHMHIQSVQQEEGLTELLTGYLLSYPTGYSIMDLGREALRFTPVRIDVDGWAAETRQTDPVLLRFAQWQSKNLSQYCEDTVTAMASRNPLREDEAQSAAEFFYAVMTAYWDGTLAKKHDQLETMPGCRPFFRCAEGYSYGWWLRDLMESASPLMQGFTLSWPD
ncbi:MAG: metallophosphoesterase [Oscillospiraceae bacterium]|nr:metallophosphoesterase [Oscillospiraceae bacterium]